MGIQKLSQAQIEAQLEPELRVAFRELIDDYKQAAKMHTKYTGGPSLVA
jgi:hypothetical protein